MKLSDVAVLANDIVSKPGLSHQICWGASTAAVKAPRFPPFFFFFDGWRTCGGKLQCCSFGCAEVAGVQCLPIPNRFFACHAAKLGWVVTRVTWTMLDGDLWIATMCKCPARARGSSLEGGRGSCVPSSHRSDYHILLAPDRLHRAEAEAGRCCPGASSSRTHCNGTSALPRTPRTWSTTSPRSLPGAAKHVQA